MSSSGGSDPIISDEFDEPGVNVEEVVWPPLFCIDLGLFRVGGREEK